MTAANGASHTPPVRVALVSSGEIYGGVERFLSTFSTYLDANGHGVPFVVLFTDGRLAREIRESHVPVAISPYSAKYDPRTIQWLARLLKDEMIDVVHS